MITLKHDDRKAVLLEMPW